MIERGFIHPVRIQKHPNGKLGLAILKSHPVGFSTDPIARIHTNSNNMVIAGILAMSSNPAETGANQQAIASRFTQW